MSKPPNSIRVAVATLGLLSAVFLVWWVVALVILFLAAFWRSWEALLLGIFMDFLWLPHGGVPLFTLGALIAVWLCEIVRSEFFAS